MIWHSSDLQDVLSNLDVNPQKGLSAGSADERLEEFGPNLLTTHKKKSFWIRFLAQFQNYMVIILLLAALVSFIVTIFSKESNWFEPILILVIVLANALLGAFQESKAENALEALKSMTAPSAKVLRDGIVRLIDASQLVPGDILLLEAGDYISADARLIEAVSCCCDESTLTGESVPVEKIAEDGLEEIVSLSERHNMVYSGCSVTHGRATAVVTETGMNSEMGKISALLEQTKEQDTPLKTKLENLGKMLGVVTLAICAIVFVVTVTRNFASPGAPFATMLLDTFMNSISLAVAAIPEGLPAIVTVVLALGVQRMVKQNAIIKNLPAVETLGSASVICSDKTGTLTLNQMTVTKLFDGKQELDLSKDSITEPGRMLLRLGAICSDAKVERNGSRKSNIGDPTEIGIAAACSKYAGISKQDIETSCPRFGEIPFDSDRKLMTTINMIDGRPFAVVKGAPEILLERCIGCDEKAVLAANQAMAEDALRVLAVAIKPLEEIPSNPQPEDLENGLVFAGLIGMIDPPRPEAVKAVALCHKAGIRTIMITGDHIITAAAIARRIGILEDGMEAITGAELAKLDDATFFQNIEKYAVYARVTPEDKLRIVRTWQQKGQIVSMTGDGVNDAPALKASDIGCAMGLAGTDVAKGAADMVLTDDNFATIVTAVREGRGIFENIRKAVHFLISCNLGEILTVFLSVLIYGVSPFAAVQLLWINLVTDGAPAIALGMEPSEPDVMNRPPRAKNENIFTKKLLAIVSIEGCFIALASLLAYGLGRQYGSAVAATMAFAVLGFSQIFHAFEIRSDHSIFRVNPLKNPTLLIGAALSFVLMLCVLLTPLASLFSLAPLSGAMWCKVIILSLIPIVASELRKLGFYLAKRLTSRN